MLTFQGLTLGNLNNNGQETLLIQETFSLSDADGRQVINPNRRTPSCECWRLETICFEGGGATPGSSPDKSSLLFNEIT